MARSFPVPVYTNTSSFGSVSNAKTLSTTSPGTTDSTATATGYALAARQTYLLPEGTANNTADTFPLTTSEFLDSRGGWILEPAGPVVPTSGDGFTVDAGTWSVQFHVSRTSGLTDSDVAGVTLRAQVLRVGVSGPTAPVLQSIGTGSKTGVTITTTETAHQIDISGAAATFSPGDKIGIVLFWEWGLQISLTGTARAHTNSTTACRITAAPTYTIQYARSLSDSAPVSDAVRRMTAYNRQLADSAPAVDSIVRQYTAQRSLADAIASPGDAITRRFTANRQLSDSSPVSDAINRLVAYKRIINDSGLASDSLSRKITYTRQLADVLNGGQTFPDGLLRVNSQGQIEAVSSGTSLPSGTLRLIEAMP